MKSFIILALMLLLAVAFMSSALAVPVGKTVEYKDGKTGPVVFDGKKHADAGAKCDACHPAIFQMKKGAVQITMKDMREGKNCGTCHANKDNAAFAKAPVSKCNSCHKKKKKVIQGC